MANTPETDRFFRKIGALPLQFSWQLGIVLVLFFGIPRFIWVLQSYVTGNNTGVSAIFICMALLPFLLLTRQGRKQIGLNPPQHGRWMVNSLLLGIVASAAVYELGVLLYEVSVNNWYVYFAQNFISKTGNLTHDNRFMFFLIFAAIGMTFSPIGEEFLFRGVIHRCFHTQSGETLASVYDSVAFGLVHLAHFGIIYHQAKWQFLPVPAILWVVLIFFTGMLFSFCKNKTGSIWGAVICHAGFNLGMMYLIFYRIMDHL